MASVTIRNIHESVKRKLEIRAARHGRLMEKDLPRVVHRLADEIESDSRDPDEAERMDQHVRALAFRVDGKPSDPRAFTDEMYDDLPLSSSIPSLWSQSSPTTSMPCL